MDICFLSSPKTPKKARRFILSIYSAAKALDINCHLSKEYIDCDLLVIYGLGGLDRYNIGMNRISEGKPLLSFDLGYWDRKLFHRKYRFSLNGMHPTQIMDGPKRSNSRLRKSGIVPQEKRINDKSPIMLVGNAPKSIAIGAKNWTSNKSVELFRIFPGRQIWYRPKPRRPKESNIKCHRVSTGDIDHEIKKVSLVVCRHSNVAIDACRWGVPVVCDSGAAACIYPSELSDYKNQPSFEVRQDFLSRLAYWQWGEHEAGSFWNWFFTTFPQYDYR